MVNVSHVGTVHRSVGGGGICDALQSVTRWGGEYSLTEICVT